MFSVLAKGTVMCNVYNVLIIKLNKVAMLRAD